MNEKQIIKLRQKEYTPEECIFWFSSYSEGQMSIHVSTSTLYDEGADDSFGSHNLKDVHCLPDYLHSEQCERDWEFPEDCDFEDVKNEMLGLGFNYRQDLNEGVDEATEA